MTQKFVILTNPRTGSEYLAKYLNNHSKVKCMGEIFSIGSDGKEWNSSEYKKNKDVFGYLNHEYEKSDKEICGYKQISNWISNSGFIYPEEYIVAHYEQGYKFIFLTRNEMLRQYASFMLMMQKGYGHIAGEEQQKISIYLNPQVAYMYIRKWIGFNKNCKRIFESVDIPYLELVYEKDFGEDKKVKQKVCDFLEIEQEGIYDPLRRTNPYRIEEMIENYDEISEYLKKKGIKGEIGYES